MASGGLGKASMPGGCRGAVGAHVAAGEQLRIEGQTRSGKALAVAGHPLLLILSAAGTAMCWGLPHPRHPRLPAAAGPHAQPGEALLRIRRVGVCGTDLHAFEGTQPFFSYPRVLGHELAGELVDTGGAAGFALDVNEQRLTFCRERLGVTHTLNGRGLDIAAALHDLTGGEMPTVIINTTGSLGAINQGFQYLAHGGRYVLVSLQKGDLNFSHPEFHKREATLMSSRNAARQGFEHLLGAMRAGQVQPIPTSRTARLLGR
jgi:threonine dehydrogenase-like Zn-dependent dehydrogenase